MAVRERLIYAVDYVTDGAQSGLRGLKKGIDDAEGAVGKLKAGWKGAIAEFKNSRAAQAALAAGAAAVATRSVQAASDLAESVNAVEKSYEGASAAVLQLGEDSIDSYGMSSRSLNEFAVRFSAFAKQIAEQDGRDVVEIVDEMAQRVADFSSVHNLSLEEAQRVAQSTLAGETEAFRRFGGDVSAATVKAHAFEVGIAEVGSELTEQQKVLARYSLFMQQTNNVAGDFVDTADSLANQQRRATAQTEELAAQLGERLVPVLEDVSAVALKVASAMDEVGDSVGPYQVGLWSSWGDILEETGHRGNILLDALGAIEYEGRRATDSTLEFADGTEILTGNMLDLIEKGERNRRMLEEQARAADDATDAARRFGPAGQENMGRVARAAETAQERVDRMSASVRAMRDLVQREIDLTQLIAGFDTIGTKGDETWLRQKANVLDYIDQLGDVPEQEVTKLLALIDVGKYKEAERLIRALTIDREIKIAFRTPSPYVPPAPPANPPGVGVPFLHDGGVVPGRRGTDVPAILTAGETVLPTHKPGFNGIGGVTLNVYAGIGTDGHQVGRQIADALEDYYRSGGRPPTSG